MIEHKIIIVDDEMIIRHMIEKKLSDQGIEVLQATDGLSGLQLILEHPEVKLIVTDYKMPRMDGFTMLKKAREIRSDFRFILMSGHAQGGDIIDALRLSASDFFIKPFNLGTFSESIKRNLIEIEQEATQKHLQEQLLQSAKLASIGELATGIAHEINQPLSYISGHVQTLLEDIELEDVTLKEVYALMKEFEKRIGRINSIISHLRFFGREHGSTFSETNLVDVFESCLLLLNEKIRLRSIELKFEHSENLPLIQGNPHQLEQVLINLFQNAIDALEHRNDGRITVQINHHPERGVIEIRFTDNGSGISPKDLGHIFDPFFTKKPVGKGTGLGLSISFGIIQAHRGTIVCESELNQGTCFIITLPTPTDREQTD
ncbi:MAG: response regulator [SAR324 cluster bacterium]|nr:response regulator [SAR324 cluster bacterium]